MIPTRTLNDCFPKGLDGRGLFESMSELPWRTWDSHGETPAPLIASSARNLDRLLYLNYGTRLQGPILTYYDKGRGLSDDAIFDIASLILTQFRISWGHLWQSMIAEYNPVDNYNAIETEETTGNNQESESGETSKYNSATQTYNNAVTTVQDMTDETSRNRNLSDIHSGVDSNSEKTTGDDTEKYFGINSDKGKTRRTGTGVNERKTETAYGESVTYTGNEKESVKRTGDVTASKSGADGMTGLENGYANAKRESDAHTTRTLTRKGNIGVTTAAQMIQGEINLWSNYSFFSKVVKDVADFLTLAIY